MQFPSKKQVARQRRLYPAGTRVELVQIYDYDKMVKWLIEEEGFEETNAEEWINYNTIRALDYAGSDSPIIMHALA